MMILLTGGCGFIGSHQAVELLNAGHDVIIIDDLSNSRSSVLDRIAEIAGRRPHFERVDLRHREAVAEIMIQYSCEAIIHFGGMKHVAESMDRPADYFDVNVGGLTSLLTAAQACEVRNLLFSSSGSVYGDSSIGALTEDTPFRPTNPYSRSKAMCEEILSALCEVDPSWSIIALRYFNPAGAHQSGLIGEDPTHLVSNIVPVLMEVISGKRKTITVNGTDYDTTDGTAVRDYVHVVDVAKAHLAALNVALSRSGYLALNIGRGLGVSVRELISAAEKVFETTIPVIESDRRPGDVDSLIANTARSLEMLGPIGYADVDQILADAWRFYSERSE